MKYIGSDNVIAKNTVFHNYDKDTGEVIFYELVGISSDIKPKLLLKGKEPYKRLFIRRVFPII